MTIGIVIKPAEWKYVGRYEAVGFGFDEYVSADGTHCKQVWDDGFVEIFEISA